jgi:hypothetical protein
MRASGGIITAAIAAAVGSLITFAIGALLLAFALLHPELYAGQVGGKWFITAISGSYLLLGVFGVWTAVDLLRLGHGPGIP